MSDRKQLSLPRDSPDRKNGETRCRTWGRPEMTVLGSLGLMEKAVYLRQPTAMEVPPRAPLLSLWTPIPQPQNWTQLDSPSHVGRDLPLGSRPRKSQISVAEHSLCACRVAANEPLSP